MVSSILLPVLTNLPDVLSLTPVAWAWVVPMLQALAPVAGAVIGGVMGNKAQKNAMKQTDIEKMMQQLMLNNSKDQNEFGKFLTGLSKDNILGSHNFLTAAANGDQNTLMQLLGKDMSNISDGARQSLQTMSQLMPRTGASAEFLSQIPFNTQMQQGRLMQQTRANAQQDRMSFGTNLASLGGNFLGGANQGAGGMLNYEGNRKQNAFDQGAQTGEAFYRMFQNITGGFQDYYNSRPPKQAPPSTAPDFFGGGNPGGGYTTTNWMNLRRNG